MSKYEPLPTGYNPTVKSRLVMLKNAQGEEINQEFTVLCSCPHSKPREHTARAIRANPENYALPILKGEDDAS